MHGTELTERQLQIVELLVSAGRLSVRDMAARFQVTPTTIRRELSQLEDGGFVRRSHGFAQAAGGRGDEAALSPFEIRKHTRELEKLLISRRAAEYVSPSETIIIDSGTTNLAFARVLAEADVPGLSVITNSLPVAEILAGKYVVAVPGGIVDGTTMALIGHDAESYFDKVIADKVFLGTTGINSAAGLTVVSPFLLSIKRKMVQSASKAIVLADSSKFKSGGFNVFCRFDVLDTVITVRNESDADDIDLLSARGVSFDCVNLPTDAAASSDRAAGALR